MTISLATLPRATAQEVFDHIATLLTHAAKLSAIAGQENADGEPYDSMQNAADAIHSALAALEAQQTAVPDGWVLVPREPTQAMLDTNGDSPYPPSKQWLEDDARRTWAGMLAAAPPPPAEAQAETERVVARILD